MGNLSVSIFIYILIVHFLADFALQTHEQATKKSTGSIWNKQKYFFTFEGLSWLTYHVSTYSMSWFFASIFLFDSIWKALLFSIITFIAHWITDYITSRIGKPFWENKDFHNGFVVVGADQVFHYVQLILTILFIKSL
jgi:hypothetical protein